MLGRIANSTCKVVIKEASFRVVEGPINLARYVTH